MTKTMLVILISLILFPAQAFQYSYDEMELMQDYEGKFIIQSHEHDRNYSVLDCQSFIHKLDVYNKDSSIIHENYVDIYECEDLYIKFMGCLNETGKVCINGQNVFESKCSCD